MWGVGADGIQQSQPRVLAVSEDRECTLVVGHGGVEMKGAAGGCRALAYLYYGPTGASIRLSHAPAAGNQRIPISPHISGFIA